MSARRCKGRPATLYLILPFDRMPKQEGLPQVFLLNYGRISPLRANVGISLGHGLNLSL